MKTKMMLAGVLLAPAIMLCAGTNDLTALLQQGLLEEEASHDLHAAITDYQALATQFDKDREIAATAIYRLGECYRKLGQTNEAVAQYERIVREFSEQKTLVTLSRQNLAGLGTSAAQPAVADNSSAELWKKVQSLSPSDREVFLSTLMPDPVLAGLIQQRDAAQVKLVELQGNGYGPNSPLIVNQKAVVAAYDEQIEARMSGLMKALKMRAESSSAGTATGVTEDGGAAANPAPTDMEDQKIRELQAMLQNSPDLINEGELGKAANAGQLRVAAFLLDHGADVNRPENGKTPLEWAAMAAQKTMVELLLSHGADVNARNDSGETALEDAAAGNYQAVVEVLLAHKADVNAQDSSGRTPLYWASKQSRLKIAQMLLAAGAKVDLPENNGRTPLSFAVENGSPEMVRLLLAAKADPNAGKIDAPLLVAISKKNVLLAETLLQAGADSNTPGPIDFNIDYSPAVRLVGGFFIGGKVEPLGLAVYMDQPPMVKLLLKFKADPNASHAEGRPLIFDALSDTNVLEALLEAGAKVDSIQTEQKMMYYGQTPLSGAASQNSAGPVEILLKHGANPNARGSAGETALLSAATSTTNARIFELLLAAKADPNARNNFGRTPLDLLKTRLGPMSGDKQAPFLALIELLRQHGALDNLPDLDVISVSRPSASYSRQILRKGSNDWNHFTLLEVVAMQCEFLAASPEEQSVGPYMADTFWPTLALPFPDVAHLRVRRPAKDLKSWKDQTVDLAAGLDSGDCANDMTLEWGDVVEIPEADHPLNEVWPGVSDAGLKELRKCLARHIEIVVKGQTNSLTLEPGIIFQSEGTDHPGAEIIPLTSFWLKPVVLHSKYVLASSDLAGVKVTRRDAKTGKAQERVFDCSGSETAGSGLSGRRAGVGGGGGGRGAGGGGGGGGIAGGPVAPFGRPVKNSADPLNDLWLRDGDVIEVPERQ